MRPNARQQRGHATLNGLLLVAVLVSAPFNQESNPVDESDVRVELFGDQQLPKHVMETQRLPYVIGLALDSKTTELMWPESQGWFLQGVRLVHGAAGDVLMDVVEGRSRVQQLGWSSTQVDGESTDLVLAFRFRSENGLRRADLHFHELKANRLKELAHFSPASFAVPSTPELVSFGWKYNDRRGFSHQDVGDVLDEPIGIWSWGAPKFEPGLRPSSVYPKGPGVFSRLSDFGGGGSDGYHTDALKDAMKEADKAPLWFFRLAFKRRPQA